MIPTTVTQKGQVTIPAQFRKRFGVKAGQKVFFEDRGVELVVRPPVDISKLRGSLKPKIKIKYSDQKANEAIGKLLAERYLKTLP